MRSAKIVAGLMLASCLVAAPASAAGLLGGALGGLSGGTSSGSSSSGSLGGTVGGVVGGLTGGSFGAPGVATGSVTSAPTGTQANVTALNGGGSTLNVGLGGVIGGNSNLGVTLPGTGTGLDGVTNTVNGLTDNGGTLDTLLGNTGLTGDSGGLGGAIGGDGGLLGTDGGNPNGPGGPTGPTGPGGLGSGPGGYGYPGLANLGAACRGVNVRGIAALIQSGHYTRNTIYQWRHAANVQVVPVKTCAALRRQIRGAIARNGNVQMVQQLAAADPLVSASLGRTRYGSGNVLGVGQSNGMLTVYVY